MESRFHWNYKVRTLRLLVVVIFGKLRPQPLKGMKIAYLQNLVYRSLTINVLVNQIVLGIL